MIFLDTNLILWLHEKDEAKVSPEARRVLSRSRQRNVSAFVRLELHYLFEKKKSSVPARVILDNLAATIGLKESSSGVKDIIDRAVELSWTRDPFNRLIVAEALAYDAPLLTSDRHILQHYSKAVW